MNTYRISYWDHDRTDERHPRGTNVVVGEVQARNGIEAIKSLLRSKGVTEDELATAHHAGSIKRLHLFGIPFMAEKVAA